MEEVDTSAGLRDSERYLHIEEVRRFARPPYQTSGVKLAVEMETTSTPFN